MTELDRSLVRRKLAAIERNLRDLAVAEMLSLEEYRRDRLRQKGIERLLQEVVEAAADANTHLLRAAGYAAPPDYRSSFLELGRHGIIPDALARSLAPAAGLRNRLVHEYDEIDDRVVLAAAGEARRVFAEYVAGIEEYIGSRTTPQR